jgi:hypothetical protein
MLGMASGRGFLRNKLMESEAEKKVGKRNDSRAPLANVDVFIKSLVNVARDANC